MSVFFSYLGTQLRTSRVGVKTASLMALNHSVFKGDVFLEDGRGDKRMLSASIRMECRLFPSRVPLPADFI